MNEQNWWQEMFDQKYLDTYLDMFPPERTREEVDFLIREVQLKSSDVILDLACGYGRHSIELARRGFPNITGLDYSETLLAKARADAKTANIAVNFVQGNMQHLPFKERFDAILMLFTAFGYFDDVGNKTVLKEIAKSLKPNGRFFFDVVSGEAVNERFNKEGIKDPATDELTISEQKTMGGNMVTETEWFDPKRHVVHNHREWKDSSKKHAYDYWLRVYTMPQYEEMLKEAGFTITKAWGDYQGKPFGGEGTFRTLILATKVAS